MAGAALRGMGKVLAKHLKKAPVLGKYARGTPTKAGLVARRAALRGDKPTKPTYVEGVRKRIKGDPDSPIVGGLAAVAVGYGLGKLKGKKEAKAKETKEKLKKSTEEHKKKTKEKRKKYGKHHG